VSGVGKCDKVAWNEASEREDRDESERVERDEPEDQEPACDDVSGSEGAVDISSLCKVRDGGDGVAGLS